MGIFFIDNGFRKGFTSFESTCISPLGLASPVAIFDTVLLIDRPNEMGRPVSLMMRCLSSCVHFIEPKKRSMPVMSR